MNWNTLAVSAKNKAEMLPDVCPCYVCACLLPVWWCAWVKAAKGMRAKGYPVYVSICVS